jgi:hypothetical protein
MQNEFDVMSRGMAHFSAYVQYVDNGPTPGINAKFEEPGFYGLLVPKQPGINEVTTLTNTVDKRTVAPALLKIPKRFFYGGFKITNPNAPAAIQGQEFSLSNYYVPPGGQPMPEQEILVLYFILRSNYGEAPLDVTKEGSIYTFDSTFYESPDAVIIELKNEDNAQTFDPFPNINLVGLDTPEVTNLIGRYGRDAAFEMLGLT